MRKLDVRGCPSTGRGGGRQRDWSTMRVHHNTYSVPAPTDRRDVEVRVIDEDRLEVYFAGKASRRCDANVCWDDGGIASTTAT